LYVDIIEKWRYKTRIFKIKKVHHMKFPSTFSGLADRARSWGSGAKKATALRDQPPKEVELTFEGINSEYHPPTSIYERHFWIGEIGLPTPVEAVATDPQIIAQIDQMQRGQRFILTQEENWDGMGTLVKGIKLPEPKAPAQTAAPAASTPPTRGITDFGHRP
jgi:hypothetical protein